jgi:hypothetical protein
MTGCGSCTDGTTCVEDDCYSDAYEFVDGDDTCKVLCLPGTFRDDAAAPYECTLDCSANCDICTDATTCTDCKTGYYLDEAGLIPDVTITCTVCPVNCEACDDATTCTECATGYVNGADTLCEDCDPAGYYEDDNGDCTECPDNCTACDDDTTCTECATGFANGEGTLCDECDTGFEDADEDATALECDACITGNGPYPDCDVCDEGNGYEPVAGVCTPECLTGEYRDINGDCVACIDNCDECVNGTKCITCTATYTLNIAKTECSGGGISFMP